MAWPKWIREEAYIGYTEIGKALGLRPKMLRHWLRRSGIKLYHVRGRAVLPKYQVALLLERLWWSNFSRRRFADLRCLITVLQRPELAKTLSVVSVKRRHVLIARGQGETEGDDPSPSTSLEGSKREA